MKRAHTLALTLLTLGSAGLVHGQALSPEIKAKLEAHAKQLQALASNPILVAAVKAHNTQPAPEAAAMTNEKWKGLTLLDPFVRSFAKNDAGQLLKSKKDATMAEAFVSGADGTKVAFLSKTTSWSHKGKEKHQVPMTGKIWYGVMEVDESTGLKQVQVGLPVLDGGKPIGSLVVGVAVASLN